GRRVGARRALCSRARKQGHQGARVRSGSDVGRIVGATVYREGETMKVKGYEILKCDAGWRTFSFLKLTTDSGPIGWSEYNESFGSPGLSGVIENLMTSVIGMDPMDLELVNAVLATKSTQSRGGVVRQAIAAIENALLDIKGKALGVPVYQ